MCPGEMWGKSNKYWDYEVKSMKQNIWIRSFVGALLGVGITNGIAIVISLILGDGTYYAVMPQLVQDFGSELTAVVVQTGVSLLYGAAWGGASLIWEREDWSITRQTVTHLVICSLATFPVAYLMRWMGRDVMGVLSYFGIFLLAYGTVWLCQYFITKKRIEKINLRMQQHRGGVE